jgi:hypothetical protein
MVLLRSILRTLWEHNCGTSRIPILKEFQRSVRYLPRCARAFCIGALEIRTTPPKGLYISTSKKIAAETDRAQRNKVATTVILCGAMRPKLQKIRVSQKTTTTSNGRDTELLPCSNISQRAFPRSIAILSAWVFSECWASFWGENLEYFRRSFRLRRAPIPLGNFVHGLATTSFRVCG